MNSPTLIPGLTPPSASKKQDGWYLVGCLPPSHSLTRVHVNSPTFLIGRRQESDLQVSSQCVSARHAEILQIGPHLFIRDLGSTNGTFLNRKKVKQPTPIAEGDHIEIANVEFRVEYQATSSRGTREDLDALKKTAHAVDVLESNWVLSQFNELMKMGAISPHYQPILDLKTLLPLGFEALARSSLAGLENPAEMFRTAEMVQQEVSLSLICRQKAMEMAYWFPPDVELFVNTHSNESLEVDILPSLIRLHKQYPEIPLVIEIHEAAIHDPRSTADFCKRIRDLGMKVAYDDFGAGQSRLLELMKAPPDYLKFDSSLIRDLNDYSSSHWRMLKTLVDMCHEVPMVIIAEGIERSDELQACVDLGFDLGQGYYLGRPKSGSAYSDLAN